jgi:hypothetical protein
VRRPNITLLGVAAAFLLVCPNAGAQKVSTILGNNFDFVNHKRYSWRQNHIVTRQGRQNDVLIDQKIVQDVDGALAAKGFVEDSTNPDFFIFYEAGASDLNMDYEGTHITPPPRVNEPQGPIYGIPQNVWYSVEGQITFHILDSKSSQPVWTATATKKIRDPHKGMKDMERQVEQIVSKTFKSFPPRPK